MGVKDDEERERKEMYNMQMVHDNISHPTVLITNRDEN
jgi:hypothetical protein